MIYLVGAVCLIVGASLGVFTAALLFASRDTKPASRYQAGPGFPGTGSGLWPQPEEAHIQEPTHGSVRSA